MMLDNQKRLVIEKLRSESYLYNKESTPSVSKPLPIIEEDMIKVGIRAKYPEEFNTLKKYLK